MESTIQTQACGDFEVHAVFNAGKSSLQTIEIEFSADREQVRCRRRLLDNVQELSEWLPIEVTIDQSEDVEFEHQFTHIPIVKVFDIEIPLDAIIFTTDTWYICERCRQTVAKPFKIPYFYQYCESCKQQKRFDAKYKSVDASL